MNQVIDDASLRQALLAAEELDFQAVWSTPLPEPPEYTPEYLAWEERFLSGEAASPAKAGGGQRRRWLRTALIAAAVAVLMIVSAVAVQAWIMNAQLTDKDTPAFSDHPDSEYEDGRQQIFLELGVKTYEENGEEFPLYEPAWLPEGVEQTRNSLYQGKAVGSNVWIEYQGKGWDAQEEAYSYFPQIYFSYSRYANFHGLSEYYDYQAVTVNGNQGWLIHRLFDGEVDRSSVTLMWYDEQEKMAFSLTYSHDGEDVENSLFRVAKSISLSS